MAVAVGSGTALTFKQRGRTMQHNTPDGTNDRTERVRERERVRQGERQGDEKQTTMGRMKPKSSGRHTNRQTDANKADRHTPMPSYVYPPHSPKTRQTQDR